jgi:hypothetical protein
MVELPDAPLAKEIPVTLRRVRCGEEMLLKQRALLGDLRLLQSKAGYLSERVAAGKRVAPGEVRALLGIAGQAVEEAAELLGMDYGSGTR